jgi:hypothetical protein
VFGLLRFRPFGVAPSEHTRTFCTFSLPEGRMKMPQTLFDTFARPALDTVLVGSHVVFLF